MARKKLDTGVFNAILAAIFFGASAPFAKILLGETSPWLLAGVFYLTSGLGLLIVQIARARLTKTLVFATLQTADKVWLAFAVICGGILGPVLLMQGLAITDAASASLLLNLEGVFTALLAWYGFRENFDRRIFMGMTAILAGGLVLSWSGNPTLSDFKGPALVAAACLAWGIDNNVTKKISANDPVQLATIKGLVAGGVNVVLAVFIGKSTMQLPNLLLASIVGFFGYGVSLLCFILALRHIGSARTGAYFSLAPFVGAAIAILLGVGAVNVNFVIAGILMAWGIWLHLTEDHHHEHVHEEMEHDHRHIHDEHHQHEHSEDDQPGEPHTHRHSHRSLVHSHRHYPDIHHHHDH